MGGGIFLKELTVVGEMRCFVVFDTLQGISQRHVREAVVVPVIFAVGGDVHKLRALLIRERADEPSGEVIAVFQNILERYGIGYRAVIKEDVNQTARGKVDQVGPGSIDTAATNAFPARSADAARPPGLVRRQDSKSDAELGQDIQRL